MNLVVVASRNADPAIAVPYALEEIAKLPEGSVIFLRKPTGKPARRFELALVVGATLLGVGVRWWEPGPGGRKATFLRDVAMVGAADEVVAYFAEDAEMGGGTGHVVEKALDQNRPCRAYALVGGGLKWIGGHDGTDDSNTGWPDSPPQPRP